MKPKSPLYAFLLAAGSSLLTISSAAAADGTWNVDANGLWGTNTNWLSNTIADGAGFTANFNNDITADRTVSLDSDRTLSNLVFGDGDTATAGSWILNNNGTATNNLILAGTTPTITVNALGTGKSTTISAIIEGTAGLTKNGTGTLILSGVNTYTGTTIVNAGTLQLGAAGVLADTSNLTINSGATLNMGGFAETVGTLTLNRGTITGFGGTDTVPITTGSGGFITTGGTVANWPGVRLGGNFTYNTDLGNETTANIGAINFGGNNRTFTIADGVQAIDVDITVSLYDSSAGNRNFIKAGAGTMRISGASFANYSLGTGTTSVQDGVLLLNKSANNAVGGTGLVTVGDGTGAANSAVLRYASTGGNDQIVSNAITINSDGLFDLADKTDTVGTVILAGGSIASTTGTLTSGAAYDFRGGSASAKLAGSVGLNKSTAGTVTLSGANSYTGATAVSAGVLNIQNATALGTTAGSTSITSGAALEIQGGITVGTEALTLNGGGISSGGALRNISGTNNYGGLVTLGSATRINSDAGTLNLTNVGTITGSGLGLTVGGAGNISISSIIGTGSGTLTKDGAGTLTLTNTNTYSGATQISNGTLAVNGTGSINNSAVTVSGGTFRYNSSVAYTGTLTYTSGTIGGTNLTGSLGNQVIAANRTLSPGNSPGTASTTSQTWDVGGSYLWEINNATGTAGADWDLENGTGTLTISSTTGTPFNIYVNSLGLDNLAGSLTNFNSATSYNWMIADFLSVNGFASNLFNVDTTNFTNNNTINGTFAVALGNTGSIGGDSSQVYLTYTAVPEPSVAALFGSLGLLALLRRRRN